ncbi:MAG: VCBS repeat-containing protein, partial [Candidatus Latescibacteria bacterium]|nr:VCBS repeat-containing protein [Candidatus Latescibacterota bacterium]
SSSILSTGEVEASSSWRILAIRVEFPRETPDDPTTTGDGTFDLRAFEEARQSSCFPYDTPPHDRHYVEWHLEALSHYYRAVSDGTIDLSYEVYPREIRGAYRLPHRMVDYGNGRTDEEINRKLVELFRDALIVADSTEGEALDFSSYQSILVFHAGVGFESGLALNDIRSAFIRAEDLDRYLGDGVRVDRGHAVIRDGWIIPESITRDGTGGLNGTMARFFGHQLGLPGLSNFNDGLPAVGGWSLMDVGSFLQGPEITTTVPLRSSDCSFRQGSRFVGFVPPHPIAWSKIRLGWIQPVDVTHDTTLSIVATDIVNASPKAVRVPINDHEYLLLENRQTRLRPDQFPEITLSGDSIGVWLSIREGYDAYIPGSGILIWHIDESVIAAHQNDNALNNDPLHRGIDLEEADGYEDIGNPSFERIDQIEGSKDDPFYVGGTTSFGPVKGYDRHDTGMTIEVMSPPVDTMMVKITFNKNKPGWPKTGFPPFHRNAPRVADLDGDGKMEIVAVSVEGTLSIVSLDGTIASVATGDSIHFSPVFTDVDDDDRPDVIIGGDRAVSAWSLKDLSHPVWDISLPSPPTASPVAADDEVIVGTRDRSILRIDDRNGQVISKEETPDEIVGLAVADLQNDGRPDIITAFRSGYVEPVGGGAGSPVGPPVVGDLNGDGVPEVVTISKDGNLGIFWRETVQQISTGILPAVVPPPISQIGFRPTTSPALGDLDDDGYLEVVAGGDGVIGVWRFNGVPQAGFPVYLPLRDNVGPIRSSPILADLNDDGRAEIVFGTDSGLLYAVDDWGKIVPGFPLVALGSISSSPAIADLDDDGRLDLVALTEDGTLHVWDLPRINPTLTGTLIFWGTEGGNNAGTSVYSGSHHTPRPSSGPLLSNAYCYPNPVDGNERAFLRFFLRRPAMKVNVRVFDVAGDQVFEGNFRGFSTNAENEIPFPGELSSGFYLCRLEAFGNGEDAEAFIKVAVRR